MTIIPDQVPGHWETLAGKQMAGEYADNTRARLCGGQYTDMEIAHQTAMIGRDDLMFEPKLSMARDRIRWLSVQLAIATDLIKTAHGAMGEPSPEFPESVEWFEETDAFLKRMRLSA